ncbi:terminase small subunit, partial [Mesomycoplasma ovipneumoniae]|uniref:terminase small subunit n=1 Tax=Mesomycoplasma ovipneumoniae TaxID=29562 RepID=UPI003080734B
VRRSRDLAPSPAQIEKFVSAYRLTFNVRKACVAAGYTEVIAKTSLGYDLLRRPDVQALLEEQAEQDIAAADLKVYSVLRGIKELAEVSIDDVMEEVSQPKGRIRYRIKPLDKMSPAAKRSIASMKVVRRNLETGDGYVDEVIEVKFWSKTEALQLLARHLGLLK